VYDKAPWPLGESWVVLDLTPKDGGAVRKVMVKVTRTDGHTPALGLSVMQYGNDRHGFPFLGSFGGRLDFTDMYGVPHYIITDGSMLLPEGHRNLSIGTWCQNQVVRWVKSLPIGNIVPISLSKNDALTESSKGLRNRFYEQFGIEFVWSTTEAHGVAGRSLAHPTTALVERSEVPRVQSQDLLSALNAADRDAAKVARRLADVERKTQLLSDRLAVAQKRVGSHWRWLIPLVLGAALGSAFTLCFSDFLRHQMTAYGPQI
jgi:hypothetical protein